MKEWKQAYRLAAFEMKASMKSFLMIFVFYIAMSLIFMQALDVYMEGDFKFFDLMFLLIFFMFPAWMKNKEFQMQKIDGNLWSSPSIIMLQQLPIPKNTIVKSRFIIHALFSFPFQLMLLIAMPIISEKFREAMTVPAYLVFLLIWLSLSIAVGFMMAAGEAGGNYKAKAIILSVVYMLIGVAVFYFLLPDDGFIQLTMTLATEWPLLSGIAAVVLGIAGWNYWQADMKKAMKKADYL